MAVISSLIPAKNRVAIFANRQNAGQVGFNRLHLGGRIPNVVECRTRLTEPERWAGLKSWLEAENRQVPIQVVKLSSGQDFRDSEQKTIVQNADVVIFPTYGETDPIYQLIQSAANPGGVIFINPVSSEVLRQSFNFRCSFDEKTMAQKSELVGLNESQTDRLDWDSIQRNSARAAALESIGETLPQFSYAERFQAHLMRPDGRLEEIEHPDLFQIVHTQTQLQEQYNVCWFMAHADDFELSSGALGIFLKSNGWRLFDFIFVSGWRAVTDEFVEQNIPKAERQNQPQKDLKTRVRKNEALTVSNRIGAECHWLDLGFYDRREKDDTRIILPDEYDAVENAVQALKQPLNLVILPVEGDGHHDHIATRVIGLEILSRIARQRNASVPILSVPSAWFTGPKPINGLLYYQPEPFFKTEFPAAYHAGRALAEAGRELCYGFANKPPGMAVYGPAGAIAEGLVITEIPAK